MDRAQQEDVWTMVDRDALAEVARQGPPPVFAAISGAHLYGFASADSDVDLRGAFVLPVEALLGLTPPAETLTVEQEGPPELDWVAHDVRKFARLLASHNGYVLEQLYSPLVVVTSDAHRELRALGRGCITRPMVKHYQGFARGRRQRVHEPEPTVKHLLYAYRVLLTGIHLMQSGEVEANVDALNTMFKIPGLPDLVERKRSGPELMRLDGVEIERHDDVLDGLEARLEEAHANSKLPDEPTTRAALDEFVVRIRLRGAGPEAK